ncbi:hypothetical protein [Nocardioides sp. URHA0020]|uniref:hypothetical protein n=1 Tax=Nocardioides sp. URHA0020 TaxID=1380392 RepID=UPI000490751F|nr:hypothetical protein [Nocardioides sp. URHA0020]
MGDRQHIRKSVQEHGPLSVEGAPGEEDLSTADVADRLDLDPGEQLNRPDQPDARPDERERFEHPPQRSIADSDHPEDR